MRLFPPPIALLLCCLVFWKTFDGSTRFLKSLIWPESNGISLVFGIKSIPTWFRSQMTHPGQIKWSWSLFSLSVFISLLFVLCDVWSSVETNLILFRHFFPYIFFSQVFPFLMWYFSFTHTAIWNGFFFGRFSSWTHYLKSKVVVFLTRRRMDPPLYFYFELEPHI